jgi:surface protein
MFKDATSFDQNISSWNISSVTNVADMFSGATSFNQDICSWGTSNGRYTRSMFRNATSFDQNVYAWDNWNVDKLGDIPDGIRSFKKRRT